MNMVNFNVSGKRADNVIFPQHKDNKNNLAVQAGEILSAFIAGKENGKVTLSLKDNVTYEFPENKIKGETGDEIFLQVVNSNNKELSFKQINVSRGAEKELTKMSDLKKLKELMHKSDFIAPEENVLTPKTIQQLNEETDAKMAEAIKKIKRQLSYASGNVTLTAISKLAASGISLEKISVKVLNSVIKEAVEAPQGQTHGGKLYRHSGKAGRPVDGTERPAESISKKIDEISELGDEAIARLLKGEKPLTIENIYIAKYSATTSDKSVDGETIDKLMPEIKRAMEREGIEVNDENLSIAKFLVSNEIPVTKSNVEKTKFLSDIKQSIDREAVLYKALGMMQKGANPLDFVIESGIKDEASANRNDLKTNYVNIINDLPKITTEHIEILLKRNNPLTLGNLQSILNSNPVSERRNGNYSALNEDIEIKTVTARRQLAEIQLKLNSEAAVRLADKNIKIDTSTLKEVVEGLRAIEAEKHMQSLEAAEAPASPGNVAVMSELFGHMRNFMPVTHQVVAGVAKKTVDFTVKSVATANAGILESYEEHQTLPNPKFGDSLAKIADQFAPMLENLGIEPTRQNIRGAAILTRNNIELNIENLSQVKLIDGKINEVYDRLNPMIAADMIKNGLNPSEMNIDEVISYINNYHESFGDNTSEKIAKYIKQMDDAKVVTKEERDSVLAIYRMLNQIQKDGGASVGAAYKADLNLTLGNLLDSAKYFRKTKGQWGAVDKIVNDDQGTAQISASADETIKTVLQKTSKQSYDEYLLKTFSNHSNPVALEKFVRDNKNYKDMSIEAAAERLADSDKNAVTEASINQYMEKISRLDNITQSAMRFMQENEIPYTINNIDAVKNILAEQAYIPKEINKLRQRLKTEAPHINIDDVLPDVSLEQIKQGVTPQSMTEALSRRLDDIIPEVGDSECINQADAVKNAVRALSTAKTKGYQHIPIIFNDKIAEISMYVMNDNIDETQQVNMFMSLDAGVLGNVSLLIRADGDDVSLIISADDEKSLENLENNRDILNKMISEAGFKPSNIIFKAEKNALVAGNNTGFPKALLRQAADTQFEAII